MSKQGRTNKSVKVFKSSRPSRENRLRKNSKVYQNLKEAKDFEDKVFSKAPISVV